MATAASRVGQEIGSYRLSKLLGEGGMGSVYKAQHVAIERQVAIKLLKASYSKRPDIVNRFFEEARSVNRIHHPNIIDALDFGRTPEDEFYIVMELLEGRELTVALKDAKGPFPTRRIGHIGLQICAALDAAHQNQIVHRDLKTDNVFLTYRGDREDYVKVLDFGIAKLLSSGSATMDGESASSMQALTRVDPNATPEATHPNTLVDDFGTQETRPGSDPGTEATLPGPGHEATRPNTQPNPSGAGAPPATDITKTRAGAVIGTPLYMSPEQALGGQVDEQTDVYALGVILYQMATGRPPFYNPNFQKLVFMHVTAKPQPPRELNPELPKKLEEVILRCLAKDKKDRYPAKDGAGSMARLAIDLAEATSLDPRPYFQIKSGQPTEAQSFLGRWWLAILLAVLLVGGIVALLRSGILASLTEEERPSPRRSERAIQPRERLAGAPSTEGGA